MKINLGFSSLLTLVFVVAKLMGLVAWSWWVVFAPVIISTSVVLFLLGVVAVLSFVTVLIDMKKQGLL